MEENAVIDLSSDSSASASSTADQCDRIAALIRKYQYQESTITGRECISGSDEDTVLISDIDEDKNSAYEIAVKKKNNEECIGSFLGNSAAAGDAFCLTDPSRNNHRRGNDAKSGSGK